MRTCILFFVLCAGCPQQVDLTVCHDDPDVMFAPGAEMLCHHLETELGCLIDTEDLDNPEAACGLAYVAESRRLGEEDFRRLTTCYMMTANCLELEACSRACLTE